jgi:UDP-N-acetyl-D-mannosaminuronic acid transferase (WecB/TagA/CpsF family)
MQFSELRQGELFVIIDGHSVAFVLRKCDKKYAQRVRGVDASRKIITSFVQIEVIQNTLVQRVSTVSISG